MSKRVKKILLCNDYIEQINVVVALGFMQLVLCDSQPRKLPIKPLCRGQLLFAWNIFLFYCFSGHSVIQPTGSSPGGSMAI